jgi:hypothetical protein
LDSRQGLEAGRGDPREGLVEGKELSKGKGTVRGGSAWIVNPSGPWVKELGGIRSRMPWKGSEPAPCLCPEITSFANADETGISVGAWEPGRLDSRSWMSVKRFLRTLFQGISPVTAFECSGLGGGFLNWRRGSGDEGDFSGDDQPPLELESLSNTGSENWCI